MFNWIKKTIFNGLLVLIPLVLLWIAFRELVELLIAFATPIADFFPAGTFDWVGRPALVAPLLILFIAFLLGLLGSISRVRATARLVERNTLGKIPMYRMMKTFVAAFIEVEDASAFRPALIIDDEGGGEPCYVIEDTDGSPNLVVLVPWSPASFAGSVRLVPRQRIRRLDITFDQFSLSLANFGLGMNSVTQPPGSTGTDKQD